MEVLNHNGIRVFRDGPKEIIIQYKNGIKVREIHKINNIKCFYKLFYKNGQIKQEEFFNQHIERIIYNTNGTLRELMFINMIVKYNKDKINIYPR